MVHFEAALTASQRRAQRDHGLQEERVVEVAAAADGRDPGQGNEDQLKLPLVELGHVRPEAPLVALAVGLAGVLLFPLGRRLGWPSRPRLAWPGRGTSRKGC